MLALAGQTAGPNRHNIFFWKPMGARGVTSLKKCRTFLIKDNSSNF